MGSSRLINDIRKQLAFSLESKLVQHCISWLILFDSATVFAECVVDAIIDDRKDVPHTWLHVGFAFEHVLDMLGPLCRLLRSTQPAAAAAAEWMTTSSAVPLWFYIYY